VLARLGGLATDTSDPFLHMDGEGESRMMPLLVCIALVVAFLVWFADLVFPLPGALRQYVIHGDFSHQFYPFHHFAAEEWWSGRVPLWNPYMYGGHPFQADPQAAVFYVPGLLFDIAFGRGGLSYRALEWRAALAYGFAACGMYLFTWSLTKDHISGVIAAFVFAGSGFLTSYPLQQLPMLEAAGWLPWCLFSVEHAVRRTGCDLRWSCLGGITLGLSFLAGHTQTTMFISYLAGAYLLLRCWQTGQPLARLVLAGLTFLLAFLMVSLPQLLPTWQFVGLSNRQPLSYAEAGNGYQVNDLIELLSPRGLFQRGYYVGVAPLVWAACAFTRRHPQHWFWVAVSLIAILLALGKYGPLYPVVYGAIPGYRLFQDQERAALLWSCSAAVLSAFGWSALAARLAFHATQRLPLTALLSLAAGLVATVVLFMQPISRENPASVIPLNVAVLTVVVIAIATTLVAVSVYRHRCQSVLISIAAIVLTAGPLYGANHGNNRTSVSPAPSQDVQATMEFVQRQPGLFRVWQLQDVLPGNLGVIDHVAFAHGDSPIYLRTTRTLLETHLDYRIAQLFNVRYLISTKPDAGAGTALVAEHGDIRTFERQYALPRAWAVRDVRVASDDATALDLALHVPEPGATAVVREPLRLSITGPDLPRDQKEHWGIVTPTHRDLDVTVADNAFLVISEPYYPGWQAFLDGQRIAILRADYAFQGLEVPAGSHHLTMVYRPPMLLLGIGLSAITGTVLLAILLLNGAHRLPGDRT